MNTLGNKDKQSNIIGEESNFRLPKTYTEKENEIPIWLGVLIGIAFHIVLPILISIIMLILTFLGLNLAMFKPPEVKPKDIEFVLVNKKEAPPINKKTRHRADRNTRAAGKHDPKKATSEATASSRSSKPHAASSSAPKQKRVVSKPRQQTPQNNILKSIAKQFQQPTQRTRPHPLPRTIQPNLPKRDVAVAPPRPTRPTPDANFDRPLAPHRPNSLSVPARMPKARPARASSSFDGGPVTSGPIGVSGSSSSPSPVMGTGGSGHQTRQKSGSGYSPGSRGSAGNPDPGGLQNGSGIDAIKEPDFGPYMRALQSRIKRNWSPPRGEESKRVVLFFKIAKDGRLLSLKVVRGSGSSEADRAALSAVELSAPFRPLPPEYRESDVDIQFTFDYNVISGYRR